ncbi:hypothetical protein B0H11DRAFT_2256529 [Mycena galericulata]|nr:hypothetical protein B0H11DRAFT_2256529 [Mycena galericulata]
MFSFSKVLAFGLIALSSVRATPFMQTPIVSCSVDFGTSVGLADGFNALDPGVYTIVNVAKNTPVRASVENGAVFVPRSGDWPGDPFEHWKLETADQGGYTITNAALGSPIFVGTDRMIYCGNFQPAEVFAISPAGTDVFDIKEVNKNEVWTVEPDAPWSLVNVSASLGEEEQLWRLIPA